MYAMLVSNDDEESAILSLVLQRTGLAVTAARDLDRALATWADRPADILVTALDTPGGSTLVGRVRQLTIVPLAMITNALPEIDHIALLTSGADLVVSRPYSARLLIAQIQVLLRRSGNVPYLTLPTLSAGSLSVDPGARVVRVGEREPRRLTHLEFRLLYTLMINRGQILPTDTLVERVWGYAGEGDRELVRGLVSRLRAKVEADPRSPQFIETVAGVGYVFRPDTL